MNSSMSHIRTVQGRLDAAGYHFGIVVSRFNDFVTSRLLDGAIDALLRHGATASDILIVRVPGAFEIPAAAANLVQHKDIDAVICLGAVIRGDTPHFDYVAAEVTKGVAHAAMNGKKPVIFGVLTTNTVDQAIDRAGAKAGNKGFAAAEAAIEMVQLFHLLTE